MVITQRYIAQRHLVFTVLSVIGKPHELCLSDLKVEHSLFGQFTKTVITDKECSILVSPQSDWMLQVHACL